MDQEFKDRIMDTSFAQNLVCAKAQEWITELLAHTNKLEEELKDERLVSSSYNATVKILKDKLSKLEKAVLDLYDEEDGLPDGCTCGICRAVKLVKEGSHRSAERMRDVRS